MSISNTSGCYPNLLGSIWFPSEGKDCQLLLALDDRNEKLLNDPTRLRQISERIPAGRWGEPRDFAGPTVFLASKAIQYVCGELLVVDGGWMGR
ncbi:hypothetical protein BKA70DRAFT_1292447 [Coprinopsis sp. MPI-PUGE-AT-0042]|nr:hypothetical protein BKA70DRAFT_1292447 [Coprinopsis sp. MPI-PUGE-AT-0042]